MSNEIGHARTALSPASTPRPGREAPPPAPPAREPTGGRAIVALFLNILGGLIVVGIQLATASRFLAALAALFALAVVASAVYLARTNRRLSLQLMTAKADLAVARTSYESDLERVGISEIAERLGTSRWSPDGVMARAQHQARFLGVFGHKWVLDASRKDQFQAMLTRVQLNGGRVQFLLLDPDSAAAGKLALFRKLAPAEYAEFHSIEFFREIAQRFDCFSMRLYGHFPFLRLIFVDGQCAISRFKVTSGPDETLDAPQLVFSPEVPGGPWTLHQGLMLLFDYLWECAADPFQPPLAPTAIQDQPTPVMVTPKSATS